MDESFRQLGPCHRRARHHQEGIDHALSLFGPEGRTAAVLHVLRDCRHIPREADYDSGVVDALGLKKHWSTAAYVTYNDCDFEELVKEHMKPSALVLWTFLDWKDAKGLLSVSTTFTEDQLDPLEDAWKAGFDRLAAEPPTVFDPNAFQSIDGMPNIAPEIKQYLEEVLVQAVPEDQRATSSVGYIELASLTNPFVYLDYELLEELKPELAGSGPMEIARFALPKTIQTPITAVGDPTQRTVTLISSQKTMTVSNVRLRATPEGTEVSYLISANAAGVVVSALGNRFLLRNGIHRAYLMAQLGVRHIPCVLIRDRNPVPFMTGAYPTFTPPVLLQPRQPLLVDFLRPELCLQAPIRRSKRLIRITADELSIPVD